VGANPVLTDAWNQICFAWVAGADGSYSTRYWLNGALVNNINTPTGSDVDYALFALVGATTNRAANYSAIIGDVGFCTLPFGDTLPPECGGGVLAP